MTSMIGPDGTHPDVIRCAADMYAWPTEVYHSAILRHFGQLLGPLSKPAQEAGLHIIAEQLRQAVAYYDKKAPPMTAADLTVIEGGKRATDHLPDLVDRSED